MKPSLFSFITVCAAGWITLSSPAWAHGDLSDRIDALTERIGLEPKNAHLLLQRAGLSRQHGDWVAALSDCQRARDLDPKLKVDLLQGRTQLESGNPKAALPLLESHLRQQPADVHARISHGKALAQLGRHAEAVMEFRGALEQSRKPDPELWQDTANSLVAQGSIPEALDVLSDAIQKMGAVPSLVMPAMELEIATKDFDCALRRVDVMQKSAPRTEPRMARRASILAQAGRTEQARVAWQLLVEHLGALPKRERDSHAMSKLA
jgi:Flp pilus assembly protein TadD